MNFIDIIRKSSPNIKNNELICKSFGIEKGEKDISKLVKKTVIVTRNGRTFQQTVYVSPETGEKEETPVGEELSPEVKGMEIKKYSEKALLITGDTYVNIDTLKKIKNDIGVGSWNQVLRGWVFPIKFLDTILGYIWSDLKNKGEDEKADAIQNQKNAGLNEGDNTNIQGIDGKVDKNVSDNTGTKYNITLNDGTKLEGVDEKVMDKSPEKDDKKISEIINNTSPESRIKSEKQLYGLKHVENIHQYSLQEYMKMHGLSQDDIDKVVDAFKNPKTKDEAQKRAGTGGSKGEYVKEQIEGLTKRQLIGKLVYRHYQAVQKAIENGEELKPEILELYSDLKESYSKKRQAMSEETKRKISEALKKDKPEEIEKEEIESEKQGVNIAKDFIPKEGKEFILTSPANTVQSEPVVLKTKDYTAIPALDVMIPKKVLDKPKPYFIPEIDEKRFAQNSFTISGVKVGKDQYLVALDGFEQRASYGTSLASINKTGRFAVMSLDTFVATEKYYQLKAKETFKIEVERQIEERKKKTIESYMKYQGISEQEAKKMVDKMKFKIPRLKVLSGNRMAYDQMHMLQFFNKNKDGNLASNTEVWGLYSVLSKDKDQKSLDLSLQQEYIDSTYTKGAKTSYGDTGTKDDLLGEYGVKVKRQNGDEIKTSEVSQIKSALDSVSKVFGNNIQMNKEFGLKISHSGNVNMHARKAAGLFHPFYNAIGVSAASGDSSFKFIFGHEYAHFMDYWVGKKTGNHYSSDKEGAIANTIAKEFGKKMKKDKTVSDYWNRSCEKFARALEMYHAYETDKDESYFGKTYYVSKEDYISSIKPLIQQFLQENKEILKSLKFNIL